MSDAVIHSDDGLVAPQLSERACRQRHTLQRGAHPRSLGVAYHVDISGAETGFAEGTSHERDDVGAVVSRCVFRQEAFTRGRVERVSDVAQDACGVGRLGGVRVVDEAYAQLVGRAFQSESYHAENGCWLDREGC